MNNIFDIDEFIDNKFIINNRLSINTFDKLFSSLQINDNGKIMYDYFNNISNTIYKKKNSYLTIFNKPKIQYKEIVLNILDGNLNFDNLDWDILTNNYTIKFIINYVITYYQLNLFIILFDLGKDNYISKFIDFIISNINNEDDKNKFYKYLINYENVYIFDIDDELLNNIEKYIFNNISKYIKINNIKIDKIDKYDNTYFNIDNILFNINDNKIIDLKIIFKEYFKLCYKLKKYIYDNAIKNNIDTESLLDKIYKYYSFDNSLIKYINNDLELIYQMKKLKNIQIIQYCYDDFQENKDLKCINIFVSLVLKNNYGKNINYHANALTILKIQNNNKYEYLCIRIEPHRRSKFYCRVSTRKYLRDLIIDNIPNSYYIDYLGKYSEGLQMNEEIIINKKKYY